MISRFFVRRPVDRGEFGWLLGALGLCGALYLFFHVAGLVAGGGLEEMELRWLRALRDPADAARPIGPAWLAEVARDVTALGGATVVVSLSTLVAGYLALRARWRRVLLIGVTVAGGYALSSGLKHGYDRPRPDVVPHLSLVRSASFPSGHSMVSSVVYLTLGALFARGAERRREKIYVLAAAGVVVVAIGLSRVFLGVHYPSDVVAGWCAGFAWALACLLVASRLVAARERASRKPAERGGAADERSAPPPRGSGLPDETGF